MGHLSLLSLAHRRGEPFSFLPSPRGLVMSILQNLNILKTRIDTEGSFRSICGTTQTDYVHVKRRPIPLRRTCFRPPRHGSSPAPFVCGGAQRGISLATGTFTGESRRNPPAAYFLEILTHYQRLTETRSSRAGFFCGSQGIQFVEATAPEAIQRKPCVDASPCARKILTF